MNWSSPWVKFLHFFLWKQSCKSVWRWEINHFFCLLAFLETTKGVCFNFGYSGGIGPSSLKFSSLTSSKPPIIIIGVFRFSSNKARWMRKMVYYCIFNSSMQLIITNRKILRTNLIDWTVSVGVSLSQSDLRTNLLLKITSCGPPKILFEMFVAACSKPCRVGVSLSQIHAISGSHCLVVSHPCAMRKFQLKTVLRHLSSMRWLQFISNW